MNKLEYSSYFHRIIRADELTDYSKYKVARIDVGYDELEINDNLYIDNRTTIYIQEQDLKEFSYFLFADMQQMNGSKVHFLVKKYGVWYDMRLSDYYDEK